MDNKSRDAKQECLGQIIQLRRAHGAETDWSVLPGVATRSLGVRPVAPPLPNLRDPALFLGFFGQTLDYAVSPHKSKHHMALGSDFGRKSEVWEGVREQITADARHPARVHRPSIVQSGILSADLFRKIGDFRLPFCSGPAVASQLFSCRKSITDLPNAKNG